MSASPGGNSFATAVGVLSPDASTSNGGVEDPSPLNPRQLHVSVDPNQSENEVVVAPNHTHNTRSSRANRIRAANLAVTMNLDEVLAEDSKEGDTESVDGATESELLKNTPRPSSSNYTLRSNNTDS